MTRICIIAGNYAEAQRFAYAQYWEPEDWFYPSDPSELLKMTNFHVLVVGSAGMNVPESYFNTIFDLAKRRGRIGRG